MAERAAIVTGAGRGIGQATALALAENGFNLTLAARSAAQLDRVAKTVRKRAVRAIAAPTDVGEPAEVQAMVDATMEAFGRIDLLVNAAGIADDGGDLDAQADDVFDQVFCTNVKGVFLTMRAVWPIMRQQPDGGVIVNLSALTDGQALAGHAVYGASKAAVSALTEALAPDARKDHIRLFTVAPHAVETALLRRHLPDFPRARCLKPQEVADIILWCTTDTARPCVGLPIALSRQ